MNYGFREPGRYLSSEENNTIASILDDEEMQLDAEQNFSSLSELDERCRSIWPNWQPASPPQPMRRSPPKQMVIDQGPVPRSVRASPPKQPLYEPEPVIRPPPRPMRFDDEPIAPPVKRAYPRDDIYISKQDLEGLDVNELKSDVDALYSKIRGSTNFASPPRDEFDRSFKLASQTPTAGLEFADYGLQGSSPKATSPDAFTNPMSAFDGDIRGSKYVSPPRAQFETSPLGQRAQFETSPRDDRGQFETSPLGQRAQFETSPRDERGQFQTSPLGQRSQFETSPRDQRPSFRDLESPQMAFPTGLDEASFHPDEPELRGTASPEKSRHVEFVDLSQLSRGSYIPYEEDTREVDKSELESLRRENIRLKAELLKVEKRLELETEERNKLMASLEMRKRRQFRETHM